MPISTVRVTYEGILLLFVQDNKPRCNVAFLKDVPHHEVKLVITSIRKGAAPEELLRLTGAQLQDDLFLDTNKPEPRVRIFKTSAADPFQRVQTSENKDDFRWAVNLEGHEVYESVLKPGLVNARLKPMLTIFDGTFYSQAPLSVNELTRRRHNEATPHRLGKVAVLLRSEITLDSGQQALFFNGGASDPTPLPAVPDVDYGIYVSNKRMHGPSPEIDADHYHEVIASHTSPFRRIRFGRYPDEHRATPDAVCLPGWMGTTELP